jgi:integrase
VVIAGETHYLGRYGSQESWEKYDRLISQWLAHDAGSPAVCTSPTDFTVVELMAAYGRHAESYYRKNGKPTKTFDRVKRVVAVLNQLYAHPRAADFGPRALKVFRAHLIRSGPCRSPINQYVSVARSMFAWAVENEMVPPSTHHALTAVKGLRKDRSAARETSPVRPVPAEPVEAIKPHVSRQIWAMIQLQQLTGMRPGEARFMRGHDLDRSGRLWEYRPSEHKTEHHDHARVIPIGRRAQAVIRPFLKPNPAAYLFSPRDAEAHRNAERRRNRMSPMAPSQRRRRPKGRRLNGHYSKDAYITAILRADDMKPHRPRASPDE